MRLRARGLSRQHGFTLVEILLCVVLLAIIVPAMLTGFTAAYVTVNEARMLELAKCLTQLKMEEKLSDPAPVSEALQPFTGLEGYSYEVVVTPELGGMTCVTVAVSFTYRGQTRVHKAVSWRGAL